jgi:uncharacterized membrane protein (UPF0127 family)
MRKLIFFIIIIIIIGSSVFFINKKEKKIYTPNKVYNVSVAKTEEELKTGLSNTNNLNIDTVKLFIFDKPDYYGFWMKDMFYPIDIIFLDTNMNVISYFDNVNPDSYPKTFSPTEKSQYVLEMNAGQRLQSGLDKNIKVYYK